MSTIENIKKISFIFFAVLGTVHLIAGLMTVNNLNASLSTGINRILDIPFLISALLYGLSTLRLKLPENNKNITIAMILFGVLMILIALYLNLAYPDLNRFILN